MFPLRPHRGLLFCAGINAQARPLSGIPWAAGMKAKTLPGSQAAWPIGLREASPFWAIALVEGGSDQLAAFHLAYCVGVEDPIAVSAALCSALSCAQDMTVAVVPSENQIVFPV